MSLLKILLTTPSFIMSGPFRSNPFPNHFPLFPCTFPLPFIKLCSCWSWSALLWWLGRVIMTFHSIFPININICSHIPMVLCSLIFQFVIDLSQAIIGGDPYQTTAPYIGSLKVIVGRFIWFILFQKENSCERRCRLDMHS